MFRESPLKLNLPPSRPEKTAVSISVRQVFLYFGSDLVSRIESCSQRISESILLP